MDTQQESKTNLYWKSLDEKYQTPEFLEQAEKEFLSSPFAEDAPDTQKSGLARRQFMKLMGASIALSTAACVRRPVQTIIPYNKRPSEVIPGLPNFYSSSIFDGREGFAIQVKTREGRPLFLRDNPAYPQRQGLSVRGTSQILSLYDPDRITNPVINSQNPEKRGKAIAVPRDWESIDKRVVEQLKKGGVAILTGETPSPSLNDLLDGFSQKVGAKVYRWTGVNNTEIRKAAQKSFGRAAVPKYRYDKAQMIVSVDGDFLGTFLNPTESSALFMANRNPNGKMSRLVSFQSVPSLTSFNADDNYAIKPSQQLKVVLGMIHELVFVQNKASGASGLQDLTSPHAKIYEEIGMSHEEFAKIVSQLAENSGRSIVVTGGVQTKTQNAEALHIAVNYLNDLLGNHGATIHWSRGLKISESMDADLFQLIEDLKSENIKTVIVNESNPMFYLPESAGFKEALAKAEMVVSTSNWMDETAVFADLIAPSGHAMENWGDNEFESGMVTIQQPTIQPMHNTRSFGDSLMKWASDFGQKLTSEDNFFSYLQNRWMKKVGSEKAWFDLLQKGFSGDVFNGNERTMGFNTSALSGIEVLDNSSDIELALYSKVQVHDGSLANVPWIQELPDPVSKITWDNYLMVAPKFAKKLGLKDGSMVNVKTEHHSMDLPIYISPGQHEGSVAVAVGYGRSAGGEVLKGVGFNVQNFIRAVGDSLIHSAFAVEIKKGSGMYELAQTQGHHTMHGRDLAVETSESYLKKTGDIGIHRHKIFSIWDGHKYDGHKWAMGVDLNACTGCSACMVACQSENNIPVVGKRHILNGREMHWIRIDRYYKGDENSSLDSLLQPVMCQHCENAPCETVCPVLATVHSDEGLNDMVYNRCVGTRYCSNNCPYKVRRFNWFYYDTHVQKPRHNALNPDVTVRTRGVMEKCTFCVQRIQRGKGLAKDENRPLKDGEIKTACQEVCPTNALIFGDLNDPESGVNKWFQDQRNYTLLEEFNAAPRVRYLAKVRNTDRDITKAHHGPSHGGSHGEGHGEESHGASHGSGEEGHQGAGHEETHEEGH